MFKSTFYSLKIGPKIALSLPICGSKTEIKKKSSGQIFRVTILYLTERFFIKTSYPEMRKINFFWLQNGGGVHLYMAKYGRMQQLQTIAQLFIFKWRFICRRPLDCLNFLLSVLIFLGTWRLRAGLLGFTIQGNDLNHRVCCQWWKLLDVPYALNPNIVTQLLKLINN